MKRILLLLIILFAIGALDQPKELDDGGGFSYTYCNADGNLVYVIDGTSSVQICDYGCEQTSSNTYQCSTPPQTQSVTCEDLTLPSSQCTTGECSLDSFDLWASMNAPSTVSSNQEFAIQGVVSWEDSSSTDSSFDSRLAQSEPSSTISGSITSEIRVYSSLEYPPQVCASRTDQRDGNPGSIGLECPYSSNLILDQSIAVVTYAQTSQGQERAAACTTITVQNTCAQVGEQESCSLDGSWDGNGYECKQVGSTNQGICCQEGRVLEGNTCVDPDQRMCGDQVWTEGFSCCQTSQGDELRESCESDEAQVDKRTTNILVDDTQAHLCGTHWVRQADFMQNHDLCSELEIGTNQYTCAVKPTGWEWIPTTGLNSEGIPQMEVSELQGALEEGLRNSSYQDMLNEEYIACQDGEPRPASPKQSIPPYLNPAQCATNQCAYTQGDQTYCVPEGSASLPTEENPLGGWFVCSAVEEQTQWVSKTSVLAQEMISQTSSDYKISCGPKNVVVNEPEAQNNYGYCLLQTQDKTVVGSVFRSPSDVGVDEFLAELNQIRNSPVEGLELGEDTGDQGYIFTQIPLSGTNVTIGYFVDDGTIQSIGSRNLWERISAIFTEGVAELYPSSTARQFYINTETETQVSAVYTNETVGGPQASNCNLLPGMVQQAIVYQGSTECYSEQRYRRIIQE